MADVLSQSQIDSLLSAALSGEMDIENSADPNSEKKYRKYDFYSPKKFTKDRLKMINSVFDNYSRIINTRLNSILHSSCEIEVESVEEQRYYEFSNAMTEGNVLTLAHLEIKDKVEETPILIFLSTPLVLSMMDRLMGGEGEVDNSLSSEYSFTDIELNLYEYIMKDLISVMGGSWENYIHLGITYNRIEVNPTLVQLIGLDETVVLVDLKIKFPNAVGRMSICMSGMILTNIFAEMNRNNRSSKPTKGEHAESIFDTLRVSDLDLVAKMGTTKLTLRDIYQLHVGDVIDLNQPKGSPVFLEIGNKAWFSGQMGTRDKNLAVKIGEVFYTADEKRGQEDGR